MFVLLINVRKRKNHQVLCIDYFFNITEWILSMLLRFYCFRRILAKIFPQKAAVGNFDNVRYYFYHNPSKVHFKIPFKIFRSKFFLCTFSEYESKEKQCLKIIAKAQTIYLIIVQKFIQIIKKIY